jgi:hypothetical protein
MLPHEKHKNILVRGVILASATLKEDSKETLMKILMNDDSSLTMFDECVILSYNKNIICCPHFINFRSEFGCGICLKLG